MMQALEHKKFAAYFPKEFPSGERVILVDETFFSEDNGYRSEEIRIVNQMDVDDVRSISSGHRVWRVR